MQQSINFTHQVNKKRTAVKLRATFIDFHENSAITPKIKVEIWQGREEYGKTAILALGEAILLADWLRESALALLRQQIALGAKPGRGGIT